MRRFCLIFALAVVLGSLPTAAFADVESERFFPSYIYEGVLKQDADDLTAGTRVRLYEAESEKSYLVGVAGGKRVRVPWGAIEPIFKDTATLSEATPEMIAHYAGAHLSSKTDFLLWVDLSRIRLYVLEYADEGWQVLHTLPCAVGDASHPTPGGRFEISYKCASIGKEDLYLCRYALCFYGGYMLHSVLFDWSGNEVIDGRLGMRISHGCVRLRVQDVKWLYDTIPIGTTVFVR